MHSTKLLKTSAVSTAVILALGLETANAACTIPSGMTTCSDYNNFTMINPGGGATGGANDVVFTWNGTLKTSVVTDGTNNATLSSVTTFFGTNWTAHHVNIYGPGTYIFDTSCPAGNPSCGDGGTDQYTLVVPIGYSGAHMLFNWSANSNIDVVQLWKASDSWTGTAGAADPFDLTLPNDNNNSTNTTWTRVSIDTSIDADLYHGTKMIDGPFQGFSANFNLNTVTGAVGDPVSNTVSITADDPPKMPSSGCSISSQSDKFTDRTDWWLVAGFVAWLGLIVSRRRQNHA